MPDEEAIDKVSRHTLNLLLMSRDEWRVARRLASKSGLRVGQVERMRQRPEALALIRSDPDGFLESLKSQMRDRFAD